MRDQLEGEWRGKSIVRDDWKEEAFRGQAETWGKGNSLASTR